MSQTESLPPTVPAVFLMGPTASGKTQMALDIHQAVSNGQLPYAGVDLISVDSAQVFRGMDIGTAKPPQAVLDRVPHALINILDPAESYSAAKFVEDAGALVAASRQQNRLPVLVGGTGLYFRALANGLSALPSADAGLRAAIAARASEQGWPALHAQLAQQDPESAARIKPNDSQRISRALEIAELSGLSRTQLWSQPRSRQLKGPILRIGLMPLNRADLHQAIETRFLAMIDAGFLEEVIALKQRGDLTDTLPSVRSVGYRQLWEHLDGKHGLDEAIQLAIIATRQYAKRQITWLNSEPELTWVNPCDAGTLQQVLAAIAAMNCASP